MYSIKETSILCIKQNNEQARMNWETFTCHVGATTSNNNHMTTNNSIAHSLNIRITNNNHKNMTTTKNKNIMTTTTRTNVKTTTTATTDHDHH